MAKRKKPLKVSPTVYEKWWVCSNCVLTSLISHPPFPFPMNFPLTSTVHMVHLIISLPFATSHLSHPLVCPSPCLISPSHLVLPSPSPISIRHLVYLPHTTCSSVFFLCLHHVCIFPCYSLCWVGLFFLLLSRSSPCHFNNKSCAFPLFFFFFSFSLMFG